MKKILLTLLFLLFTAMAFGNFEITEDGVKVLSQDGLSSILLSGSDQEGEGLGIFKDLTVTTLTASLGVYTDAQKTLTSTIPSLGTLGFWTRTEGPNLLTTATSGDGILTTGTLTAANLISSGASNSLELEFDGTTQTVFNTNAAGELIINPSGSNVFFSGSNLGSIADLRATSLFATQATLTNDGGLQLTLNYDGTFVTRFTTDSIGDLTIAPSGNDVFINPSRLTVLTDLGNQLALKYDLSNTVFFSVSSAGDLTITPSGGDIFFASADLSSITNLTATGIGTFGEVNIGSLGDTDTLLAVGTTDTSTFPAIAEFISSNADPTSNNLQSGVSVEPYWTNNSGTLIGNYVNSVINGISDNVDFFGIFGGLNSVASITNESLNMLGLDFVVRHMEDFHGGPSPLPAPTYQFWGLRATSNLGWSGKIIDDNFRAGSPVVYGGQFVASMNGTFNPSNKDGLVYGGYFTTTDNGIDSTIDDRDVDAYGVYIDAATAKTFTGAGSPGELRSWGLFEANGANNYLNGPLYFTQIDGAERITSDADGTLDLYAGTSVDIHVDMTVTGDIQTDGLNFTSAIELTISSGAVTVTKGHHSIDTEGDTANDDLDTINGGDAGEILLILPADDTHTVRIRHGVGNIYLKHQTAEQSYNFNSPTGSSGVFYVAGFYDFPTTDGNLDEGGTTLTHGDANGSHAAHASLIASGAGTATGGSGAVTIVVTGTSIDDEANRVTSDSEVIVADITAMSTDEYFETSKKWLGVITYTLTVGGTGHTAFAADFNYGLSKYEDLGNTNFSISLLECVGRAGGNDTGFNIRLFHHNAADWTYAATGFVPGPTAGDASELANMNTDHGTEKNLTSGDPFAYKRTDLNQDITGDNGEGIVIEITTSANRAVEAMDLHIGVHSAPKFAYMATTKQHLIFMKHGPNWLEL